MRALLILFISASIISSCNKNDPKKVESESVVTEENIADNMVLAPPQDKAQSENYIPQMDNLAVETFADTSKKIIKTGDIRFEVRDVLSTRRSIIETTKKLQGYISEETESGYANEQKQYKLDLRVPAQNFDALLQAISSNAEHIDSKNIQIQDVTVEYIDIKTRLQNKKILEKRYLELLNKASKINDMLAIEDKLSEIRTEIESETARFLQLQKQVAYSTLSITFYSKSIVQETGKGFLYKLKDSVIQGWDFMQGIFFNLISFWPLSIGFILLVLWLRRRRNRRRILATRD